MKTRHKAREFVMQAIYQWQATDISTQSLEMQFYDVLKKAKADFNYFTNLLRGIIENCTDIDQTMQKFLDRALVELNPVELAILRLSIYELKYCLDIPYKVSINEALELAKKFGSVDGYKYVNGVLDKASKQLRMTNDEC